MVQSHSDHQEESQEKEVPRVAQESLEITSGRLLIIDQFMPANAQFHARREALEAEGRSPEEALALAAEQYGGCVVPVANGSYAVSRDPRETIIIIAPAEEGEEPEEALASYEADFETVLEARGNAERAYRVFVDTRCVVFIDAGRATDPELISKYGELRGAGEEKRARDFIREHGGAVRYGFNRYGDELGVFKIKGGEILALWPDVVD